MRLEVGRREYRRRGIWRRIRLLCYLGVIFTGSAYSAESTVDVFSPRSLLKDPERYGVWCTVDLFFRLGSCCKTPERVALSRKFTVIKCH